VENARLQRKSRRRGRSPSAELEIGRKIQSGFLPAELPVPAGWEIAAHFQPARQVSGDFYDVFADAEGRYTASSSPMSATTVWLRRCSWRSPAACSGPMPAGSASWVWTPPTIPPASQSVVLNAVQQTNAYIADIHGDAGMFATLFFGILNPTTGELRYVNGGHEPPMLIRNGQIMRHLKERACPSGPCAMPRSVADSYH